MAGINLEELEPQRISTDLKGKFALFYGLPGVGKTSMAAQFPKALIMGFECGTNALDNVYVQPIKTWQDWKSASSQLLKKPSLKEKFDCIAIDTADAAWELCVKYICGQNGVEKLSEIPWGDGYDQAKKEYANAFRDLTYAGYGIVFISHSVEKTFKDERGEEYVQINPALPARPYDIINKMVDVIGYIREISTESGERKRYIFFRGDQYFFAKSRFKYIVPKIEFSYENFVKALQDAIQGEIEHNGGSASSVQNPYLQRSFDDLMVEAKEIWGAIVQRDLAENALKILEEVFGKPTKFSEIQEADIEKLKDSLIRIKELL